jgi:hypothetical protein
LAFLGWHDLILRGEAKRRRRQSLRVRGKGWRGSAELGPKAYRVAVSCPSPFFQKMLEE